VTVDIRASGQRRRELRLRVARRQVPEVLVWAGALTLVFGVVNYLTLPDDAVSSWIVNLVFGPFCLLLALALRRGVIRGEGVPWAWAAGSVVLVAMLVNTFRLDPTPANLAYLVAVITAFGPLMHVWGPFIVSGAAMVAISGACFLARPAAERVDDLLVVLAALAISALLLHLRISALNALADSQAQLDHLAMFDPMTDTLNRNGLDREIAALSATAGRSEERILVWFVDVRGLKAANDEHGHTFGDAIILAVTRALRASVRANDLIARWGGDEFVVVGIGSQGEAAELNERVDELLTADGSVPVRWSRSVTIGFASGSARADIYRLIGEADADMYRRRLAA
jgi:diguanylate cyclase (GGDEF)-like protein